jgi:hypothetical protein
LWLRDIFAADDAKRRAEWKALLAAEPVRKAPPDAFLAALAAAMPEPGLEAKLSPRVAGAGSLGRLRILASVDPWRGGPLAREAKAVVASCWDPKAAPGALYRLASGPFRAPDPWLRLDGAVVVRRLSPNSRKLELEEHPERSRLRLLKAMARDIAAVHAGEAARCGPVRDDLKGRGRRWLREAACAVAAATERDWKAWKAR